MHRFIRHVALVATLVSIGSPVYAQRGGRGNDSTGGRGAGLPLTPTKALKFTTDEGTWLSLDVSPDGSTIVFELLGDIYTLPIAGGKATRITSGQMFDAQPHYSPDGKSIVFVSDRSQSDNLWVMNADGSSPHALTRENDQRFQSPAFTPDGKYVVASKGNNVFLGPTPSKDGRYIYFAMRNSANGGYNQTALGWQIGVLDRETGRIFTKT